MKEKTLIIEQNENTNLLESNGGVEGLRHQAKINAVRDRML